MPGDAKPNALEGVHINAVTTNGDLGRKDKVCRLLKRQNAIESITTHIVINHGVTGTSRIAQTTTAATNGIYPGLSLKTWIVCHANQNAIIQGR